MKFLLLVLFTLISQAVSAEPKNITIGMGNFKPYFIEEGNRGIASEIIAAAFKHLPQYRPIYRYGMPVKSAWALFEKKKIDAAANLFDTVGINACRSDPVIQFRDVVVSLKSSKFVIKSWADLQNKNIVTFQGAKEFFGQDLINVITRGAYSEFSTQEKQAYMLDSERADISVGDLYIFMQGLSEIQNPKHSPKEFVIHDILPQIASRIAFHDETVCKDFNLALKKVKDSGQYEAIYKAYRVKLGLERDAL